MLRRRIRKKICPIAHKTIFKDVLQAKLWASNQEYDTETEPYRDPRCGHIHLRTKYKKRNKEFK